MIKPADIIADVLNSKGVTRKAMAERMGVTPNTISRKISENRLTANEFVWIADSLGFDVTLVDREDGEYLKVRKRGTGCRVRRMVNDVMYDTSKADAICHTPTENGWYIELYQDEYDRYFAVHYSTWEGVVPFITLCPDEEAKRLIEAYCED